MGQFKPQTGFANPTRAEQGQQANLATHQQVRQGLQGCLGANQVGERDRQARWNGWNLGDSRRWKGVPVVKRLNQGRDKFAQLIKVSGAADVQAVGIDIGHGFGVGKHYLEDAAVTGRERVGLQVGKNGF